MNDRRKTRQDGEPGAGQPRTSRDEPDVVRLDDWVRRRQRRRVVEPDDDTNGPDPGPSAA